MKLGRSIDSSQKEPSFWGKLWDFIKGQRSVAERDSTFEGKRYFSGITNYYTSSFKQKLSERNVTQSTQTSSIQGLDAALTIVKIHAAIRQAGTADALSKIERFIHGDDGLEESNKSALLEALDRKKQHLSLQ